MKCFVIDDHPMVQEGLQSYLQKQHPKIQLVGTWKTVTGAAEAICQAQPDILILDHYLPDGTGLDILLKLQNVFPMQKVVVMSRLSSALLLKKYLDHGVRAILSKSSDSESLQKALVGAGEAQPFICHQYAILMKEIPQIDHLTSRELEVIQCIVEGKTNKEAGQKLNCSEFTIKTHKASILRKLELTSSTEIGVWAVKNQILSLE